jgi:hypothetical protein
MIVDSLFDLRSPALFVLFKAKRNLFAGEMVQNSSSLGKQKREI